MKKLQDHTIDELKIAAYDQSEQMKLIEMNLRAIHAEIQNKSRNSKEPQKKDQSQSTTLDAI